MKLLRIIKNNYHVVPLYVAVCFGVVGITLEVIETPLFEDNPRIFFPIFMTLFGLSAILQLFEDLIDNKGGDKSE